VVILGYLVGIFWGPKGVAVSAAVTSGLVQIPMMWWAVTRSGPVSRADALRLLLPLIVATAVSGGALGLLSGAAIWSSFGGLVLAVLVAYALFGAALALFPSGRAQMRRAIGMARRFRRA
jgi:PST family polysaccharide transporter